MASTINGNTLTFHLVEQTAPDSGVPATPVFENIRRVSGDLDRNPSFTASAEVDPTRQAPENVLTQFAIEGSFDGEFPLADTTFHKIIESALQSDFSADLAINASTISFDNGTSEIRDSANGFTNIVAGQFIGVFNTGSQTEEVFYVTSKTDNGTIVVNPAPVTEAAGATVDIVGQNIRNNKTQKAFTVQKRIPANDASTEYRTLQGCQVGTLSVDLSASSLLTTTFSLVGLDQLDQTTAVAGQTDSTPPTARVIGSVSGVPSLFVDGVKIDPKDRCLTNATIEIDNSAEGVYCVGDAGAAGISFGSIAVTGTYNSYVDGTDITSIRREKSLADNETLFGIGIVLKDQNGNYLVFERPYTQYTAFAQPNTANGDLLENQGTVSSNGKGALSYTIQCTYIAAP